MKSQANEPIAITGIGMITSLGDSAEEIMTSIDSGRVGASRISFQDCSEMPASWGGQVDDSVIASYALDRIRYKLYNRYLKLGVIATSQSLAGAFGKAAESIPYPEHRRGIFVSTGTNGENVEGLFEGFRASEGETGGLDMARYASDGLESVHPQWILTSLSNNLIFFLTSEFQLRGDNNNTTYDPVGGCFMLGSALRSLRQGFCDMAVVTGTDSILNWQAQDDLAKIEILSTPGKSSIPNDRMLPFSTEARGALPGEGACSLVLEPLSRARARGAEIYCTIRETTTFKSPFSTLLPEPSGAETEKVISDLLSAQKPEEEILVNLNGMGNPAWDIPELKGSAAAARRRNLLFTTTKAWLSHTYSASMIMDTALTALILKKDYIPALICSPDQREGICPEMNFQIQRREGAPDLAVCLCQGPGGNTGGVLIEKSE